MNLGTYWVEDVTAPDNIDAKVSEHFKLRELTLKNSSPNSQHTHGNAADIVVVGVKPIDVYNYFNSYYPDTYGVGIYNTFVHIDVRPNKARWDYRTKEK